MQAASRSPRRRSTAACGFAAATPVRRRPTRKASTKLVRSSSNRSTEPFDRASGGPAVVLSRNDCDRGVAALMANEDKATRYHRLQRRASVLGTVAATVLLLLLVVTGGSAAIRDVVTRAGAGAFVPTVAGYVLIVFLVHELLQTPFAYYQGVVLERRYGL